MEQSEFCLTQIGITEKFQLKFGENVLGRCETNDVITKSVYASRKHCIIVVDRPDKVAVKINGSLNGVYENGKKCAEGDVALEVGDTIGIGCDTSIEEQSDAKCFVLRLERTVTGTKRRLVGASDTAMFHDQPPQKIKPASTSATFIPLASSTPRKVNVINEADGVNKSHPNDKDVNPADTTALAKEPIARNDEIGDPIEWIIIDDSSDSDTEHAGKSAPNGNYAITSSSKSTAKTTVFKGTSDVIAVQPHPLKSSTSAPSSDTRKRLASKTTSDDGAEFNPNSTIKGHVRCPSIRKVTRAVTRYKETDCIFVDEFNTSQHCGICLHKFAKATKSYRFKKCTHCSEPPELPLTKAPTVISRESKRNRQHHRRQTNTAAQRSRRFVHDGTVPLKGTTWQRDICACRCIHYKGMNALQRLPIDERLLRTSAEFNNDDEDDSNDDSNENSETHTPLRNQIIIW